MDLDDLRRQWQQPEAALPPLSASELDALLTQRTGGLVEKMRRNARLEMAFNVLVALAMPVVYALIDNPLYKAEAVLLLLLALGMFVHYRRKLEMLRRLTLAETNVRENLRRLCSGLREMLSFHHRITIAAGPLSLIGVYGFYVGQEMAQPGSMRMAMLLTLGGALLALGLVLHFLTVKYACWYRQRVYGQYLDRLEANLEELSTEPVV